MPNNRNDLVQPRTVSMYGTHWPTVESYAQDRGYGSTSAALRRIIDEWTQLKRQARLVDTPEPYEVERRMTALIEDSLPDYLRPRSASEGGAEAHVTRTASPEAISAPPSSAERVATPEPLHDGGGRLVNIGSRQSVCQQSPTLEDSSMTDEDWSTQGPNR